MSFHRSSDRIRCRPSKSGRRTVRTALSLFAALTLSLLFTSSSQAATYTGTNTGAITDGTTVCGPARDVQFNVTGFSGNLGSVSVQFTMSTTHTWIGDLVVTLIAPNSTSHVIFGRVGSTTGNLVGDNSNATGPYTFSDTAANNFWAAAAAAVATNANVASNSYRTQPSGPAANANPGPAFSSMIATFATVPPASVNGTWTLRFEDCAAQDTGAVGAATLTLIPVASAPAGIAGRVVSSSGKGIRNVMVSVFGGNLTEPLTTYTGSFGYYRLEGLEAGQTYIVTVAARRFRFENPTRLVNLEQTVEDFTFVATQ